MAFRKADESLVCSETHDIYVYFFSDLNYYVQKQVQLLSLLSMNKCVVFLWFLNKGSTMIKLSI
jgi:hypothetical protein